MAKVGEEVPATFGPPKPYSKGKPQATTHRVWQDVITSKGASYIAPHFATFDLPPGDYVVVRSPDGSRSWKYEGYGKGAKQPVKGGFWGIHIPGDTAIVELHSKGGSVRANQGYTIDKYARGAVPAEGLPKTWVTEALCGIDDSQWARCTDTSDPLYLHSKPVARLLINGTSACTGWLVGNQGHLLTNHHCIENAADALNTDYEFMAEGLTCTTNCASWLGCPGTVVATNATLVQTDAPRDYTLVQLPTNPTETYGYLQLRNGNPVVNERIYVPQYPLAWGKRIAINSSDTVHDPSGFIGVFSTTEPACQTGGPQDVGYFADTQGGSSGSPVLSFTEHLVIALHQCANCPNRGVPSLSIINNLGANLPTCALRSPNCPDPLATPFRRTLTAWDQPEQGWGGYTLNVVDVSGDGRADLVWNGLADVNRTYVALSNGNGTFRRALTAWDQPERGWGGYTLNVADVNADGRADLVWNGLADVNRTYVALSNGDGTFRRALTAWDQPERGWSQYSLHVADVTGDRKADLLWNERLTINRTYCNVSEL